MAIHTRFIPPVRLAALGLFLVLPKLALAHAILTTSTPAPGGTIASGHQTLAFNYNSRIDHKRSRLTLTGPDGKPVILTVTPASATNALDAEADLVPGAYTLRWQALALDGHITRGDVPFTVVAK
ncbi:MAG: copper resistance CopC family protein [Janthinobacterium lividum]